jgi:SAM-dependent methyltransferase
MMLCPDVIAFPESPAAAPERWVLMNVFAKTSLGVGPEVFEVLAALREDDTLAFEGRTFRTWPIAYFSHMEGLLADPSRFRRDAAAWGEPARMDLAGLVKALRTANVVIDDLAAYRARFQPKKSLLDRDRFGNYHEQLGQQLLVVERKDPTAWWVSQKFTEDLSKIRSDNLYGVVQDRFLDDYLPHVLKPGATVLDLGCGPGVIANKMARLGARVVGLDPNADYIRLATEHAAPGARFEVRDVGKPGVLDDLEPASFDFVYMSDALLFYFVPYAANQRLDVDVLIGDLRRLLKPSGTFLSLEPHSVFYLLPWLGAPERPFTVVTEYSNEPRWRVNPTLSSVIGAFTRGGFAITGMEELRADRSSDAVSVRAAHFASEFPLWQLLEMKLQAPK